MENKKTRSFRSRNARRRISGFLASVLVFVFVFEQFFMSLSYAATAGNLASASDAVRSGKISWKDSGAGEVQLAVLSDESLYEAGDQVCLDVYIKNNTDQEIYDGLLKFKAGGILEDSVYFEDIGTVYQEPQEDGEPEDKASEDEEPQDGIAEDEDPQDGIADDEASEGGKTEGEGTSDGKASEDEGYAGELSYTVSKPVTKEDTAGDDEEMMDGGEDEEIDLSRVSDLILEPGEIRYVQFYFTIDDEIEGNKSQTIKFTFSGKTENKPVSTKETFRYVVGAMNLLPVEIGNEGKVAAGETARMRLSFELGEIEDMIVEREMELGISHKAANAKIDWASASDASASDADRDDDGDGSDDGGSKLIKWDGEKADSGKKEDQPIIKNLKCTVDTPGLKLNGFKAEKQGDDEYGTSTICSFEVDEDAKPGVYFGQVTASYQIKSKKFQTTQSVMMTVSSDGRVEAEALTDDPEVLEVIRMIRELPDPYETMEKRDALEEAGDEDAYYEFIMGLCEQVMPVYEAYMALTEEQQALIPEEEQMIFMAYASLLETMMLSGEHVIMATYPRGNKAWENDRNALETTSVELKGGWSKEGNDVTSFHGVGWWPSIWGTNEVAYCIEPGITISEDVTNYNPSEESNIINGVESLSSTKRKAIGRIISASSAYKGPIQQTSWTPANDKEKMCKIIAAQLLVWEVVVGERDEEFKYIPSAGYEYDTVLESIDSYSESWKTKVKGYYTDIESEVQRVSKEPTLKNTELKWDQSAGRYQAVLEDTNKVLENFDVKVGAKTLSDGKTVTVNGFICERSGNKITIYANTRPTTTKTLSIEASRTVKRAGFLVWSDGIYSPDKGGNNRQDVISSYNCEPVEDILEKNAIVSINAVQTIGLKIQKKDATDGESLSGVKFKLSKGNDVLDEKTTDARGEIQFDNLGVGNYVLEETQSRTGYNPCTPITFSIIENPDGTLAVRGLENATISATQVTLPIANQELTNLTVTKIVDCDDSETGSSYSPTNEDQRFEIVVKLGEGTVPAIEYPSSSTQQTELPYVENGIYTLNLKNSEIVTIKDIPTGTKYEVTENPLEGNEYKGYSFKEIKAVGSFGNKITNEQTLKDTLKGNHLGSAIEAVTVTNKYFDSKKIPIKVRKTWPTGNDGNFVKPGSITVQLWRKTSQDNSEELVGTVPLNETNNWEHDFGQRDAYASENEQFTYFVKETEIAYPSSIDYEAESIGENLFRITRKVEDDQKAEDALKEVIGIFQADETVDGDWHILENKWMPATNTGGLEFSIKKTDENGEVIIDAAHFELYEDAECRNKAEYDKEVKDGITHFVFNSDKLKVGSYYLREEKAPEGYHKLDQVLEVKVTKELKQVIEPGDGNTSWENSWEWTAKIGDYDLKQIYELANDRIKISMKKRLEFDDVPSGALTGYEDKEYTFEIYEGADIYDGTEISKDAVLAETLVVKADGTTSKDTTELLKGNVYTIVEKTDALNTGEKIENYTWKEVKFTGSDADVTKPGYQVKIDENTSVVEITATNSYTRNKADLLITKQIDYNKTTSYDPDPEQEFTVKVWLGSTEAETPVRLGEDENVNQIPWAGEGSYTLHVKGSETAKITDIPVGTKYVIIETRVLNHSGEPDSRYTFGGIVLKKGTDANQPEEPSPADNAEDKPDVPGAGNSEDGSGLPNPDGAEANPPASEIPATEIIPAFQELRGEITDNGQEKWEEEVTVINRYHDQKLITIEGEKNWQNLNSQMITEDGLLPYSIHINLMRRPAASADGEETENTAELVHSHEIKVDGENKWKYTFADLPQYVENTEIPYEYFIVETGIQYDMEGSDDSPYMVEPIEGMDNLFKVSRKETTDGLHEVIGVFRVSYEKKDAVETEDGRTVQEIGINNTWEIAFVENRGNAFLEITKEDSADKKPLANAEFTLSVRDVDVIRRTDEEGKLTFGELPVGTYVMKETGAPDGYQNRDTQWTVTVSRQLAEVKPDEENPSRWINVWNWTTEVEGQEENGNQLTVENDRIQGSISLAKALVLDGQANTDPVNQEKEYTFGIYRGTVFTGEPVETLTVKADGSTAISGQLDYGVYTISEIRRSDVEGHNWAGVTFSGAEDADKDAAGFQVMIAEQGETLAITAVNHYDREEEETTTTDGEEETTTGSEEETTTGGEEETTTGGGEETTTAGGDEESTTGSEEETTTTPESSSAEETTAPVRGGGSGNGGGGGGGRDRDRTVTETVADENVPLANIDPEDVPLANLPNAPVTEEPLVILDEDVPLVGLAKTGDRSMPIGALVGLLMVSLLGALGISRKRKEDENS